jgi:phage shock protein PspC (stress-responsive transcriptional regulator)
MAAGGSSRHDGDMTETQPQDHPTGATTRSGSGFFDQLRSLGVRRSSDRWVAGVCGGLARRLQVDPLLIRAGMIALLIFGIGFLAYLVAWALLPDEDGRIVSERAIREGDGGGIFLLVVIGLVLFGTGPVFGGPDGWWSLIGVVAVGALVWWLVTRQRGPGAPASGSADGVSPADSDGTASGPSTGSQARPEPVWAPASTRPSGYEPPAATGAGSAAAPSGPGGASSQASSSQASSSQASASTAYRRTKAPGAGLAGFLVVLGAAVVGYGLGQLVGARGSASADLVAMVAAAGAAGLATIVLGLLGRRSALASLTSIVLAVSLLGTWGSTTAPAAGGQQTWRPLADSQRSTYEHTAGQAVLDLRGITEPPAQPEISASVRLGELVIYVPEDVTTRVVAEATLGSISVDDSETSPRSDRGGTSVSIDDVFGEGEPELTVRADVQLGSIRVVPTTDPS